MNGFRYDGVIPSSKSHFNRALICASYGKSVILHGESQCDDVVKMKAAVQNLGKGFEYDCGSAGTVLRFFALRVSRIPGRHVLRGTPRLMSRPQEDLREVFNQLGIKMTLETDRMIIEGEGWKPKNNTLHVNREKSSQFVSGILLNAWDLDFPLRIEWGSQGGISEGYWQMSVQVVKDFGMKFDHDEAGVKIPANSKINITKYDVESDISSMFAIAAYAALNGEATFRRFPFATLQPDKAFLSILEKMGAGVERLADSVRIFHKSQLKGVNWNLGDCPDLFPVLATLCAFATSPSRLDGAPHLIFKESNRIEKTAELLRAMGVENEILSDGMIVSANGKQRQAAGAFVYDTDHDHRLAFAAALMASQGFAIEILHPEVVNKSFPEFWDLLGVKEKKRVG